MHEIGFSNEHAYSASQLEVLTAHPYRLIQPYTPPTYIDLAAPASLSSTYLWGSYPHNYMPVQAFPENYWPDFNITGLSAFKPGWALYRNTIIQPGNWC